MLFDLKGLCLLLTAPMMCSEHAISPSNVYLSSAAHLPPPIVQQVVFHQHSLVPVPSPSPLMQGILSFLFFDMSTQKLAGYGWQEDRVVRVLDANTIKLDKAGLVSLGTIKTPQPGVSTFEFSECLTRSPSYKLNQLLSKGEKVRIKTVVGGSSSSLQAVLIRVSDGLVVNEELVRTGFARVRKSNPFPSVLSVDELMLFEENAREEGLGLFQRCKNGENDNVFEAQFEPLELTTETRWSADGGKTVLRGRDKAESLPPNPGDKVGCSDFAYYEDALKYYENFYPYYGDVGKLDRDGDGVPCPGLPHIPVAERYRMKIPKAKPAQ